MLGKFFCLDYDDYIDTPSIVPSSGSLMPSSLTLSPSPSPKHSGSLMPSPSSYGMPPYQNKTMLISSDTPTR
jgi:hypothetical protein